MLDHKYFLNIAFLEANKAAATNNLPIGAIVVDNNNKIIGKGYNNISSKKDDPFQHAELIAIKKAMLKKKDWRLNNCKIYCTLEPCLCCLGMIINTRISELYYVLSNNNCNNYKTYTYHCYLNKIKPKLKIEQIKLNNKNSKLLKLFFANKRK